MRVNAYESEYRKFDESVNIHKFGKISSSVNVVQTKTPRGNFFFLGNISISRRGIRNKAWPSFSAK